MNDEFDKMSAGDLADAANHFRFVIKSECAKLRQLIKEILDVGGPESDLMFARVKAENEQRLLDSAAQIPDPFYRRESEQIVRDTFRKSK